MDYRLTTLSVMLIILCILIILVVRYKNNKYEEVKKYIDFIEKTLNEKLNELRSELSYVKLNRDIHFVTRIEYDAVKKCLSYYVDENIKLRKHNSKLQECANGNFVHLFTHNGIKHAFRTIEQLYDFLDENKLSKVTIQSIQFYEKKSIESNENETTK